ncbi:hypothetical protein ID867_14705 [Streptomyces parvulus]|nr:hypothetical protein [Streptomyces parvulus]
MGRRVPAHRSDDFLRDQVKIKPSSLNFAKELVDNRTVRVKVPYSSAGYRFSVEFDPQLYTAYNDMSGPRPTPAS